MSIKYIEKITFDEIINQALEQKEEIAKAFLRTIENYQHEYSYYTLIVDFNQNQDEPEYYLDFIVDTESNNGYFMGFNLRIMTICTEEYSEDELNEVLIIKLLQKELAKLKNMTINKN